MSLLERELETSEVLLLIAALAVMGLVLISPTGTALMGFLRQQISIFAIPSVTLTTSFFDILYEPRLAIDPTFYLWEEGAVEPTRVYASSGRATPTIAPNQTITWAAGGYGCTDLYYWEKENVSVGNKDKPLEIRLYAVASCSGVKIDVFDSSYRDVTVNPMPTGVGSDFTLEFHFDVTEEYSAVRRPHICVNYDDSVVKNIKINNLEEIIGLPTRIVSGLDQCFDTGIDYYLDNQTRLKYNVNVDIITGADPTGTQIDWYIIDMDKWWKDGELYFINPVTFKDMGAGTTGGTKWIDIEEVPQEDITCTYNVTTWFEV